MPASATLTITMMSKPPLRHHTKYDINMIFMRSCTAKMHPADFGFEMWGEITDRLFLRKTALDGSLGS